MSKEQKSITEEIINLSCTHLHLDFCILLYRTQETKWMYTCPSNLVHHTDVVCLCPHITVLVHWAKIICLNICLTPEPGCLWMAEVSGSLSHLFLQLQNMAAHSLHAHWADQVKSCEKTLKASWKSLHNLQTSWRDHRHKKKSPLSHSVLNRCHINNFLHWDVQTSDKQFPTVQHEAPRRKTQCAFTQIYVAVKPSCETNVPWNTRRGKRF